MTSAIEIIGIDPLTRRSICTVNHMLLGRVSKVANRLNPQPEGMKVDYSEFDRLMHQLASLQDESLEIVTNTILEIAKHEWTVVKSAPQFKVEGVDGDS